jgi:hypothetical protein
VGEEIVNCITLWFPPADALDSVYKTPVAVLANNDHTVTLLDLPESSELDKLTFPDCVNRSLLSPDGQILITIGDDPFMYVHIRKSKKDLEFGFHTRPSYEWQLIARHRLKGPRVSERDDMKGSFASAFSPSGRYLAVGTQYGIISIFDVSRIIELEPDPLITTFKTSRAGSKAGAVRAIEFSPPPFDLLAWTEENGKFGVADVRDVFMSRQIVTVTHYGGVSTVDVKDKPGELLVDQRLRDEADSDAAEDRAADSYGRSLRLLTLTRELQDRHHTPLTPEETEVLEALQMHRRVREARRAAENASQGTGRSSESSSSFSRTVTHSPSRTTSENNTSSLPSSLREFLSDRNNSSLRAYINDRNAERERRTQPRRRASIILAAAQDPSRDDDNSDVPRLTESDWQRSRERRNATTRRLPALNLDLSTASTGRDSPSNPWREFDALFNDDSAGPADPPHTGLDVTTRLRIDTDTDERREYARRQRAWRGLEEGGARLRLLSGVGGGTFESVLLRGVGVGTERSQPDDTTGLCWSGDGRTL